MACKPRRKHDSCFMNECKEVDYDSEYSDGLIQYAMLDEVFNVPGEEKGSCWGGWILVAGLGLVAVFGLMPPQIREVVFRFLGIVR